MQRRRQILFADGLRQEQQAEEALFQIAVEKARSGAKAFLGGGQPAMQDAAGGQIALYQIVDQRVIAFAAAFGRDDIGPLSGPGESCRPR